MSLFILFIQPYFDKIAFTPHGDITAYKPTYKPTYKDYCLQRI